MFTGIVEGTGRVSGITRNTGARSAVRLTVDLGARARGLREGQSVALNGVCLTATRVAGSSCTFDVIDETVKKTGLGALRTGARVNVERSLRAGARLEGHFVLGHVDGTGTIRSMDRRPGEVRVCIGLPRGLARYVVKKGSIAVDGVSLTVTSVRGTLACVSLIPHTMKVTNFGARRTGDKVNIETDILGKYALK